MGEARHRNTGVHVSMGILGVVFLITAFAVGSGSASGRALGMAYLVALWGLGYWLALTTPPRRRSVNGVLALAALCSGLFSPLPALALLAFVWSVRRSEQKREALAEARVPGRSAPQPSAGAGPRHLEFRGPLVAPNMAEAELLPFLNPRDWGSKQQTASEQLIAGWDNSPLVSLGWDSPRLVVIAHAALLTPQNKATALANLRKRPNRPEWERVSVEVQDGIEDVFVRLGDVMTASDLWDPEFVRDALQLAGSECVFFAVPTRESMVMATSPEPAARLALARIEDYEHGEFLVATEIIAFDGEQFSVLTPVRQGRGALH